MMYLITQDKNNNLSTDAQIKIDGANLYITKNSNTLVIKNFKNLKYIHAQYKSKYTDLVEPRYVDITEDGIDSALGVGGAIDYCYVEAEENRTNNVVEVDESKIDGRISSFNQGTVGCCMTLSIIECLGQKDIFSDSVSITKNDSTTYKVSFNNYNHEGKNNSTTVTQDDISTYTGVYGDIDVSLTVYALDKLLKQNGDGISIENVSKYVLADYFFGQYKLTNTYSVTKEVLKDVWNLYKDNQISNLAFGFAIENQGLGIYSYHAYSMKTMTDSYISIVNPWDTNDELTLDLDTFISYKPDICIYGYDENTIDSLIATTQQGLPNTNIVVVQESVANWINSDAVQGFNFDDTLNNTCQNEENNILAAVSENNCWTNLV